MSFLIRTKIKRFSSERKFVSIHSLRTFYNDVYVLIISKITKKLTNLVVKRNRFSFPWLYETHLTFVFMPLVTKVPRYLLSVITKFFLFVLRFKMLFRCIMF